jgi:hypothetical protein
MYSGLALPEIFSVNTHLMVHHADSRLRPSVTRLKTILKFRRDLTRNSLKEYHSGERKVRFTSSPNLEGVTYYPPLNMFGRSWETRTVGKNLYN